MSQPLTLANLRQSFVNFLDEDNYFTQLVKLIEDKTKVNREYIAYGKQKEQHFISLIFWSFWFQNVYIKRIKNLTITFSPYNLSTWSF